MANQTTSAAKGAPMSPADVRAAIERGDFTLEAFLESLVGQKMYVRAGGAYRELIKENGAARIGDSYATCYRLGKRINADGTEAPARTRKKKA